MQTAVHGWAAAHDVPDETRSVVLDHEHDRPPVDAEVVGRDPPTCRTLFHGEGLVEGRLKSVGTVMPGFMPANCRTVGMTISGANGSDATTRVAEQLTRAVGKPLPPEQRVLRCAVAPQELGAVGRERAWAQLEAEPDSRR